MKRASAIIYTCEHASWKSPPSGFGKIFLPGGILKSHRGWDQGALPIARHLAGKTGGDLLAGQVSRLFVDLNRREGHAGLHDPGLKLTGEQRRKLVAAYHVPFRNKTLSLIQKGIKRCGFMLHLSIHSFTPVFRGQKREFDLGLLFDPRRKREKKIALQIRQALAVGMPGFRLRFNQPYRGRAEGHTTRLRECFSDRRYAGLEIEFNQAGLKQKRLLVAIKVLANFLAETCEF